MKRRVLRIAKLAAYPLFYLFCLGLFGYLCFPFEQLRGRIIAEFDRMQASGSGASARRSVAKAPMRLEIGDLDSYWFSGVEISDARLVIPPAPPSRNLARFSSKKNKDEPPPTASVITIDRAHARVRLLPLLIGDVRIDFTVVAFGGEIEGTVPYGTDSDVEVEFEGVQLGEVDLLKNLTGLPVLGAVEGSLRLSPKEGKFSKADGNLDLKISRVVIGDGKATLQGVALPAAQVGDLTITANAKDGVLKLEELSAAGRDFELQGDGRVRIRERWSRSRADLYLKFKFTDVYRDKTDTTRSLLGKPGSKMPPALEFEPRIKRSKREDGFYGWHVHGALGDLRFDPQAVKGKTPRPRLPARKPSARGRTPSSPRKSLGLRRPPAIAGRSTVGGGRDADEAQEPKDDKAPSPSPAPPTPAPEPPSDHAPAGEAPSGDSDGPPAEGADPNGEGHEEPAGDGTDTGGDD